jgi:tetratricopeptide (TPR) repeat protein
VYAAVNHLFTGALELEQRQFQQALRDFRYALGVPRARPLALLLAGEALYGEGHFREAEMNFNLALQEDPKLVDAHRWLAIAYYDIGLMHEAVGHLQLVAELDPSDARPHRVMAVIHIDLGSLAIAVEDFEESLRRDPKQPDREEILTELAQAQLSLKRFEDAQRTLADCAPSAESLAVQANCAHEMGDNQRARQLADKSLELNSEERAARVVLAKLALDERRYEDAVVSLSEGVKLAPADYDLRYTLVVALRAAGQSDEAEKHLEIVEELRSLRERFDELIQESTKDPYNAEIRYQLGLIADRLDTPEVARSWFKAAVALDGNHNGAQRRLRELGSATFNAAEQLRGA